MAVIQKQFVPKRITISFVLFCFLLTQVVGGIFLYAKPANAQLVVSDPVTGAQTTVKNIKDFLKIVVVNGGMMAMINAVSNFTQKIAYDLAVSLASGGSGEMPLFSTEGWGDYLSNTALDAAGEFIGSFSDMFGVNLCAPPNPQVGLAIQLGLADTFGGSPPTPRCEWSQISSNWDSFISQVQTEDFLRQMASQFQVGYGTGTDMGIAISGYFGAFGAQETASDSATATRQEGQGFLPLTELISGRVKTPAEAIRQASEISTQGPVEAENLRAGLTGQALSAGAEGILAQFVSTFLNTLLSKSMQRLFTNGMYSLADLFPKSGSGVSNEEGTTWGGRKAAELAFADFLTPQVKEGGAVDILTQFIVCPDKFKGQNNCVMDGNFESAVRQAQTGSPLTVKQALDQKLLHADWPLIPPTDAAKNQDIYCYTYAYCYSNLAKMRKARVIPIGWEIAALSSTSDRPVRLGEVVSKFNDCNDAGVADADHPYCHMIDPNWILKAPAEQCRASVYGPVLQTAENSFRQEICVDSPTCIAEDDNGNCEGGWGYCLREKNIWRLNGDKCDAQYDTCRTLQKSDGQTVSYLVNTIDNGPPCTSEDVGCRWYSTRQSKVADAWVWQDVLTGSGATARRNDRIFFNKNISQCDEPGCNEFLQTNKNTKLNYVSNSSFEEYTDNSAYATDTFKDWPNNAEASSDTYFGQTAMRFVGNFDRTVNLGSPKAGRSFVLSFYTKNISDTETCAGTVTMDSASQSLPANSSYGRVTVRQDYASAVSVSTIFIRFAGAGNCLVDAVQLEEGTVATNYHEGWGQTAGTVYLTSAPDYYSCYDYNADGSLNKSNDAAECGNYAKACEEKDVGCEKFTPANGDPWIPGVAIYPDDYCPAECVGYQTFKQVGTDFEQEKFPVYFIPSSAKTCSAADVGCDQFTSLETEAVANFSSIRRCEKPSPTTSATFYTWEGSDTSGYQLKTWNLKISDVTLPGPDAARLYSPDGGRGPCTRLDPTDSSRCADDGVAGVCTKAETLTNPDCREFYDKDGNKHYRLYSKTIIATDDCHIYRKTASNSSDCGISGGKWDATKSECTYQVYLPESRACSSAAVGCRAYRGNSGANVAVISNDNFDSGTLGASDPSGWNGGSISAESLSTDGKSMSVPAGSTVSKDVATSIHKGGIYTLSFWAKGDARLDIKFASAPAGQEFSSSSVSPANLSFDWRYFSLGPVYVTWDPAAGETLRITTSGGTLPAAYLDNIVLREVQDFIYLIKNSWTTPASCDRTFFVNFAATDAASCTAGGGAWSTDTNECIVSGALPQSQLGCALYRDRANRDHYLKSFSRLCSPDAAGCEKLIKTWNNSSSSEETFNTENDADPSLSPEERMSDNVTIPADKLAYLIVDNSYSCKAENKGCASFGAPALDATGNVKVGSDGKPQYDTVNLLADSAKYIGDTGKILCQVQYQGCEAYTTTEGGSLYFKDPGARTCEWKENVTVSGRSVTGWFKKGSDPLEACDPMAFYGGTYNIWKNGDIRCTLPTVCNDSAGCSCTVGSGGAIGTAGSSCTVTYGRRTCPYSGWVGECPGTANMCTKFIDPADTTQSEEGQAYYYIKNNKLTPGNCNGTASERDGCVLLNDTSVTQLNYNASATYISSENKTGDPGGPVAPIDCTNSACRICVNGTIRGSSLDTYEVTDIACTDDSDCPGPPPARVGASGWKCRSLISSGGQRAVQLTCPLGTPPPRCEITYKGITYTATSGGVNNFVVQANDSNILLKVRRDRVCGEWLDCMGTNSTFDSQTGRQKNLCEQLGVCKAYNKSGEATKCVDWAIYPEDPPDTYRQILTKELYTSRDTSYKGMEYSGDSIYNQYQAADLRGVNVGTEANPENILAFVDNLCYIAGPPATVRGCGTDPPGYCDSDINGSPCGAGLCYNHLCVTNFRGDPTRSGTPTFVTDRPEIASCRAYPEQSSPFPTSVVSKWGPTGVANGTDLISKKPGFSGANVCERQFTCDGGANPGKVCKENSDCSAKACVGGTEAGKSCADVSECAGAGATCEAGTCKEFSKACECNYKKVSYSGGAITKYFSASLGFDDLPYVCVGGPTPGKKCDSGIVGDCGDGGQCVSAQKEDISQGWFGYCLERDTATSINGDPDQYSCLTWYPIDQLPGMPDIYNNYAEAGFAITNAYYCADTNVFQNLSKHPGMATDTGQHYCVELSDRTWATSEYCDGDLTEAFSQCLKPAVDILLDQNGRRDVPGSPGARDTESDPIKCNEGEIAVMATCGSALCDGPAFDNDCAYKCVPRDSYHASTGEMCSIDDVLPSGCSGSFACSSSDPSVCCRGSCCMGTYRGFPYLITTRNSSSEWSSDSNTANDDCVQEGYPWGSGVREGTNPALDAVRERNNPYFGCNEFYQVSTDNIHDLNRAWTDRVWEASRDPYILYSNPATGVLAYNPSIATVPFGRAISPPSTNFLSVATCKKDDNPEVLKLPNPDLSPPSAGFTLYPESGSGLTVPNEARSLQFIEQSAEPVLGTPCSTDAQCNDPWYCGAVTCYQRCASDSDCGGSFGVCQEGQCENGFTFPDGVTTDLVSYCTRFGFGITDPIIAGQCTNGTDAGAACETHTDCKIYACDSASHRCIQRGTVAESRSRLTKDTPETVLARIQQLFAKRYNLSAWQVSLNSYEGGGFPAGISVNETSKTGTPAGPPGSAWPAAPRVYAMGSCTGEKCKQGIINSISINGVDGDGLSPSGLPEYKNVVGSGGEFFVEMKFFGEADKNSMPIRSIATDWNDSSDKTPRDGRFKNHLGLKSDNSTQCDNTTFGRSDNACTDSYFRYTHVYSCPAGGTGMASCDTAPGGTNCYAATCPEDVNGAAPGKGSCCVYKPKVQIKDNWGWCNGYCPGGVGGTDLGCYEQVTPILRNECDVGTSWPSGQGPWTPFQGLVIVVPR